MTPTFNRVLGEGATSVRVDGPEGIMAERPVYFNYKGTCRGGHVTSGTGAPANGWYFAEGTLRGGFEEWLCLLNPNGGAAEVDVDYRSNEGDAATAHYSVPPTSRYTVCLNDELPGWAGKDASCAVTSTLPLVAERSLYHPGASFEVANAMDNLAYLTQIIGPRVRARRPRRPRGWLKQSSGPNRRPPSPWSVHQTFPLPTGRYPQSGPAKSRSRARPPAADHPGPHYDTPRRHRLAGQRQRLGTVVSWRRPAPGPVPPGWMIWVISSGARTAQAHTPTSSFAPAGSSITWGGGPRARRGFVSVDRAWAPALRAAHGHRARGFLHEIFLRASRGNHLPILKRGATSSTEAFEKAGLPPCGWSKDDPSPHPADSIDKIEPAYLELTGRLLLEFIRSL